MRGAGVHFDFRGQIRLGKCLFQSGLIIVRPRVVIRRDRNQELRLALRRLKVRTVRRVGH